MNRLSHRVLKRRKIGREMSEKMRRVSQYLTNSYMRVQSADNPIGFVPVWRDSNELLAARIVNELHFAIEHHEAYARTETGPELKLVIGDEWCGAPMPRMEVKG